jgi:hypothetical protein
LVLIQIIYNILNISTSFEELSLHTERRVFEFISKLIPLDISVSSPMTIQTNLAIQDSLLLLSQVLSILSPPIPSNSLTVSNQDASKSNHLEFITGLLERLLQQPEEFRRFLGNEVWKVLLDRIESRWSWEETIVGDTLGQIGCEWLEELAVDTARANDQESGQ